MRAVGTPSPSHTSCSRFLIHVFRNSGLHRAGFLSNHTSPFPQSVFFSHPLEGH